MALAGDERYSVCKEFTGDYEQVHGLMVGQRWVVRFCGEFVAATTSKQAGLQRVAAHQSDRRRQLVGVGPVSILTPREDER